MRGILGVKEGFLKRPMFGAFYLMRSAFPFSCDPPPFPLCDVPWQTIEKFKNHKPNHITAFDVNSSFSTDLTSNN